MTWRSSQIGDQAGHAFLAAFARGANDLDAIEIGTGRPQPRHDGVVKTVLDCQDDHASPSRVAFAERPLRALRDARGDVAEDLILSLLGQAHNQTELADGEAVGPQPIDGVHLDRGAAEAHQSCRLRLAGTGTAELLARRTHRARNVVIARLPALIVTIAR